MAPQIHSVMTEYQKFVVTVFFQARQKLNDKKLKASWQNYNFRVNLVKSISETEINMAKIERQIQPNKMQIVYVKESHSEAKKIKTRAKTWNLHKKLNTSGFRQIHLVYLPEMVKKACCN